MLNTDICSYAMKRRSAALQQKLITFAPGELKISVITAFELYYGACRLPDAIKARAALTINTFTDNLKVLDFDRRAAEHAGVIRTKLTSAGKPIGAFNLLIAAHARSINAVMVTNSIREFSRVDGLVVENWSAQS